MGPRVILMTSLALVALAAQAQMATSPTHQLETLAITGGGGAITSATRQMQCAVGQSTPLAATVTIGSVATPKAQPGLIPTLYPRTLLGDSNNDTRVDAADVVTSVNISHGSQPVPTNIVRFFNADVNTDGQVDAGDIAAIADLLLGL